jgi:hypothetical protein
LSLRYTSEDNQFDSADDMIACLRVYFISGNERDRARVRFYRMYMQESKYPQEDFLAFKARFIANALEGGIAESEWFTAL